MNDILDTATLPPLKLKKGKEAPFIRNHPWLFSGALEDPASDARPGLRSLEIQGKISAWVMYNPAVSLCARLLPRTAHLDLSQADTLRYYLDDRLRSAIELRRRLFTDYFRQQEARGPITSGFRLINAEGDGLPGIILDYYDGLIVAQVSTAVAEMLWPLIRKSLLDLSAEFPAPLRILERSDGAFRRAENLPARRQWFTEEIQEAWFLENGIKMLCDLEGQKTGFFLDMRNMRELLGQVALDADVLNLYSYTGAFGLHCLKGGARRVVQVDRSSRALELARSMADANELVSEYHSVDVDEYLKNESQQFDIVISDPPAFAKKKGDVKSAARAYRELNRRALERTVPGGMLLTCSCSHFITEDHFASLVMEAATLAGRQSQILSHHRPALCHPVALPHREGSYLKSLLLRVY
ncbi:MAG: class I SAM-dependent rRNA methyltransferase [Leptospiraceae bacterium]|nr:class I SAM-dependent rRNA methyltransferase [Leptospiraceae bacterium]